MEAKFESDGVKAAEAVGWQAHIITWSRVCVELSSILPYIFKARCLGRGTASSLSLF